MRFEGIFLWPALIPDGVGLMFNDAGIIRADARSEQHPDDVIPPDTPVAATL